jgi:hypothetical protein
MSTHRRTLLPGLVFILSLAGISSAATADYEWKMFTFFGVNDMPTNLHRTLPRRPMDG